ncbi:hypothetical protein Pfo_015603 [Paulownia fortunei]|nr:hypothetical protein Pfo_015603 [Paulownia fortunei]
MHGERNPLPLVDGGTLAMVITYLNKHAKEGVSDDEKRKFDELFVSGKELGVLFDVVLAANYLNIKDLLDMLCQKIADTIKNKDVRCVREIFGIENDFTPEEEQLIRDENAVVACEKILEEEKVHELLNIGEFPLYMIPLDEDVLSFELDLAQKEYLVDGDATCLWHIAKAIHNLEFSFGVIPNVRAKGKAATRVADILNRMQAEEPVNTSDF